jgi:2-polyprenyl-3-methyl-5-hydroxy-6-metoxy-1,4-benzoquinol methylase
MIVIDSKRFFYVGIAKQYDHMVNPYDLQRRLEVVYEELLPSDLSTQHLLDVGCGTGWFSSWARTRGAEVTSLDVGESLLQQTLSKACVQPVIGDALVLPFQAASFDIVVSSEVIEHTVNPEQAVTEMARVLRPKGFLALTCPNHLWKWSVMLLNWLGVRPFRGYENFLGYLELRGMVSRAGLQVVRHQGFHLWPYQATWFHSLSRRVDAALGTGDD